MVPVAVITALEYLTAFPRTSGRTLAEHSHIGALFFLNEIVTSVLCSAQYRLLVSLHLPSSACVGVTLCNMLCVTFPLPSAVVCNASGPSDIPRYGSGFSAGGVGAPEHCSEGTGSGDTGELWEPGLPR